MPFSFPVAGCVDLEEGCLVACQSMGWFGYLRLVVFLSFCSFSVLLFGFDLISRHG